MKLLNEKLTLMKDAIDEDSKTKLALKESVKDILHSIGKLKQSLGEVLKKSMTKLKELFSNTKTLLDQLVINKYEIQSNFSESIKEGLEEGPKKLLLDLKELKGKN